MGRPERHDADYFPFYVKDGKTLYILESKYGLQGIGFFTNLMRFLTRQTDHHICIQDESDRLYFFAQIRCPEDVGMDMIELMVKTGKLDADLWAESRVIVSQDLLDSLCDAYKNRNNPIIKIAQIRLSYLINEVSYPQNPITSPDKPQRKLKERKLKESKEKAPPRKKLTDEEWLESLKSNIAYANLDILKIKGKCEAWCNNKGKVFTRARFLNWLNREETPIGVNNNGKPSGYRSGESKAPGTAGLAKSDDREYPVEQY